MAYAMKAVHIIDHVQEGSVWILGHVVGIGLKPGLAAFDRPIERGFHGAAGRKDWTLFEFVSQQSDQSGREDHTANQNPKYSALPRCFPFVVAFHYFASIGKEMPFIVQGKNSLDSVRFPSEERGKANAAIVWYRLLG